MRRRLRWMSVVLCIVLACTGCWDARELEERTSAMAIGIDKLEKGYQVSVQVPIPSMIGGEGGGDGGAVELFYGQGDTLNTAFSDIQKQTNQNLFLGHAQLLVFGEEVAKDGIQELMDGLRRHPDIRRRMWPMVVRGKAKEVLELKPKLDLVPSMYIRDLIEAGVREGWMGDVTLGDVYNRISNPATNPLINQFEIKEGKIKWTGLALFNPQSKVVGTLDSIESAILIQIRSHRTGEVIEVPYQDGKVIFRADRIDSKSKMGLKKKQVTIKDHVIVEGVILEKTCTTDLEKTAVLSDVEKKISEKYHEVSTGLMTKLQREFRSDGYIYGDTIRARYPRIWRQIVWEKAFTEADIDIHFDVKVKRIGLENR
ncbi:Ger(x)C family spore germination protein [Mechercharimyces sp. CAU 1602]|uniref:Ger(x)C family spore germination protein n=1 Tax=Mechercharimyces sp. CAU 1602 TaxID=2973933 RepID=UPI002161B900|nr:Ger(x)C family spore germination protein [Mechercharimyces sp. CAU 1602]MCS1351391.1 Ger(x)C family spore germination protein [Mechercharimyces sp. CAU 1602]